MLETFPVELAHKKINKFAELCNFAEYGSVRQDYGQTFV